MADLLLTHAWHFAIECHEGGLAVAIERRGPISLIPLADAMVMDRATLGHNIRPLEAAGYVARLGKTGEPPKRPAFPALSASHDCAAGRTQLANVLSADRKRVLLNFIDKMNRAASRYESTLESMHVIV